MGSAGASVLLNERYRILVQMPVPELSAPGMAVFGTVSLTDPGTDYYAAVCLDELPPRLDILPAVSKLDHPALVKLADYGRVDWPSDGKRRFVLVFERPAGQPMGDPLQMPIQPMTEEQLIRVVLRPLVSGLRELNSLGIAHGGVRAGNLFYRDSAGISVMLGDGYSTPPSYGQPVIYETIERGMAMPIGRGQGNITDDLYALGVTLVVLMLGGAPLSDIRDDVVLAAKLENGSYASLLSEHRAPVGIMEPLRGLLNDDRRQRWTLDDLELWLTGRRLNPKQPQIPRRAARALPVGGVDCWNPRTAAAAIARNSSAAVRLIDSGDLERWLRRSLSDEPRAASMATLLASAISGGRSSQFEDRLAARVAMVLDPRAPIRYKDASVRVDGIAGALAVAAIRGDNLQNLAEIVAASLPMFWASVQYDYKNDFLPLIQTLDAHRQFLDRATPGGGVERLLYELNPELYCLSPLLRSYHANTPAEVMRALNAMGRALPPASEVLDRHTVAFLAARQRSLDARLFALLTPGTDETRRLIATLAIFSAVLRHTGQNSLPELAQWCARSCEPVLFRFRNRKTRDKLRLDVKRSGEEGDITSILGLVDNPDMLNNDEQGFLRAHQEYRQLNAAVHRLQNHINEKSGLALRAGRQVAVLASFIAAAAVTALVTVIFG